MSLFAILLLAASLPVQVVATEVVDLYTVQVPIDRSESDWREKAYARGLAQVLVRATGQRDAGTDLQLQTLFGDPAALVQGYQRGADETLWISFDGRAIGERLRQAGRAVWGAERPLTLVWLAVDRGRGEREIIAAAEDTLPASAARSADPDRFLRERVDGIATERGIPIVWPLLDSVDLEAVSSSDIWGGFDQPVLSASARYGANSVLVGRIDASGRAVSPRWNWYFGGEERQWRASVEDAVHRIADLMAGQLAAVGDEVTTRLLLTVTGVETLRDYAEVDKYLTSVSMVRSVALQQFLDDSLTYRVELRGDRERLTRVLRLSGRFDVTDERTTLAPGGGGAELRAVFRR